MHEFIWINVISHRFHAADEAVSQQLLTWYYENQRQRTNRSVTNTSSDPVPTIAVPRHNRLNVRNYYYYYY
jgi:hypothetical protein